MKRDALVAIEKAVQERWESEKEFETNPPAAHSEEYALKEKFMVTFPYPYMNGKLHLGHSFSLSKAEFAAGFERMRGKRVLFPFGFHCTGMPIKACADKLRIEIETFGNPPVFPVLGADETVKAKHGKVAAKTGNESRQFKIMESMGIPVEEIPKFQDPSYWLRYFPPHAINDLKALGAKIDWRRSFITTDANPYYDAFIAWQFRKLKNNGFIDFGKRYTIYSKKDGQPCMDHDRASGEGVEVQEFVGALFPLHSDRSAWSKALRDLVEARETSQLGTPLKVSLVTATLRPETFYGLTNVWVGVDLEYGIYQIDEERAVICCPRAARNLALQGFDRYKNQEIDLVGTLKGSDLIGLAVIPSILEGFKSPYDKIYCYPMMNLLESKGTAIVASVPSDSPDDYRALKDLQEKAPLRVKFNLTDEQVLPFVPIGIIKTEGYDTTLLAEELCQKLSIKSQNDKDGLAKAKDLAYRDGFYRGRILVGRYKDLSVLEAKPLIKEYLFATNQAFAYAEPSGTVVSRSGDECVVALVDQWYIKYGDVEWTDRIKECIKKINFFHAESMNQMDFILGWLREWACSRSFGLGTRLPWDHTYLIESLSDSTIYMAYYTIAHYLHEGSLDGSTSPFGIQPEDLTDEVLDYILLPTCVTPPQSTKISVTLLESMKSEFSYFYPMDLRVSGKDLLFNHLAFMLFNHEAVFGQELMPKAIRANGHLLLNSEKMSKSTGNFLTMADAVLNYTADCVRFALADAGDTLDDANFLEETADHAILRLYSLLEFILETMALPNDHSNIALGYPEKLLLAQLENVKGSAYIAYENMQYREALKVGFYELVNAKDRYLQLQAKPNKAVLLEFVENLILILAPIVPHFAEYVWRDLFKRSTSITSENFPKAKEANANDMVIQMDTYLRDLNHSLRTGLSAASKPKKNASQPSIVLNAVQIYVAKDLPDWQAAIINLLKKHYNVKTAQFEADDATMAKEAMALSCITSDVKKKTMPFLADVKKNVLTLQSDRGFIRTLPFDEMAFLENHESWIDKENFVSVAILDSADSAVLDVQKAASALPGQPGLFFYSCN